MAAIISRITRENRLREKRLLKEIPINKSNYILPEFGDHYNPTEENSCLRRKQRAINRDRIHKFIVKNLTKQEMERQGNQSSNNSIRTFICEFLIIMLSLSLVPGIALALLFIWPEFKKI